MFRTSLSSGQQVAQTIDHIFQRESGGACAGREFSSHLRELTFALGGIFFQFFIGDECARPLMGFEQAAEFQFAVSPHYRIGIDGEIDRELAHRRQLIAGVQRTGGDATARLVDQLSVDGDAAVQVDGE